MPRSSNSQLFSPPRQLNGFLINGLLWLLIVSVWVCAYSVPYLFSGPRGIHYIRQTDVLAFVQLFMDGGMPWYQPETYNVGSGIGHGASEFPFFYWLLGKLWSVVGQTDWHLRVWNASIFLMGLFFWLKFLVQKSFHIGLALLIGLITMGSAVLWYYGVNFLPDAAALGFLWMGWYFLHQNQSSLWRSIAVVVFFSLCGLMKPTFLILPVAFLGSVLAETILNKGLAKIQWKKGALILLALGIVSIWVGYVKYYNSLWKNDYFLFSPRPIWELTADQRAVLWQEMMRKSFLNHYGNDQMRQLWMICLLLAIVPRKEMNRKYYWIALFSILGSILYFLLFFQQFRQHDYYFLPILTVLGFCAFLAINNLYFWLRNRPKAFIASLAIVLVFIVLNAKEMRRNNKWIFKNNANYVETHAAHKLKSHQNQLQNILPDDALVVILEDYSMNGGLRTLRRKGWTIANWSQSKMGHLEGCIHYGANYIIDLSGNTVDLSKKAQKVYANQSIALWRVNR